MALETTVQVRIDEDLRAALQGLADTESRSLSQYIRLVLIRHVQDLHKGAGKVFAEHKAAKRKVKP